MKTKASTRDTTVGFGRWTTGAAGSYTTRYRLSLRSVWVRSDLGESGLDRFCRAGALDSRDAGLGSSPRFFWSQRIAPQSPRFGSARIRHVAVYAPHRHAGPDGPLPPFEHFASGRGRCPRQLGPRSAKCPRNRAGANGDDQRQRPARRVFLRSARQNRRLLSALVPRALAGGRADRISRRSVR